MESDTVNIRSETPADYDAIRAILIAAFADHPFSHQTEHLIVEALRADNALTLALVAEVGGEVAGHVAFSTVLLDDKDLNWLALGPVAVKPTLQRRGIGSALVREGLRLIRSRGAEGCILVGDPAFYTRFGFINVPTITMVGVPPSVLLCLPFTSRQPQGRLSHHAAFSVTR